MNKKLFERFYKDECSTDEGRWIQNYFKEHPEELDAYFSEREWALSGDGKDLDPIISERMKNVIHENIEPKKPSFLRVNKLALVASFLLLTGLGLFYFITNKKELKKETEWIVSKPINIINETDSILKLALPDGSLVELFPTSELNYNLPFDSNSRKVFLSGIANFEVRHDPTRPFSVISEEIATTALGTSFKVVAENGQEEVSVQLYEGSVVIRNAELHKNILKMDYYLKPGEVFFYNRTKKISWISGEEKTKNSQPAKSVKKKEVAEMSKARNNWYMFNNQPLAMVFESLETIYDVKIKYDIPEINEMSFIGRIERNESIENLLEDIARLNDLHVTKNGNSFSITKK